MTREKTQKNTKIEIIYYFHCCNLSGYIIYSIHRVVSMTSWRELFFRDASKQIEVDFKLDEKSFFSHKTDELNFLPDKVDELQLKNMKSSFLRPTNEI